MDMQEIIPDQSPVIIADEQRKQLILAIKKTRIERRLSYQAIVDGCEKNGDYVSASSVRRVCAEGSENMRFRYDTTLRPIARFVLGLDENVPPAEAADQDGPAANELLRIIIGIKEEIIAERDREIAKLLSDNQKYKNAIKKRTIAISILVALLILSMGITIIFELV